MHPLVPFLLGEKHPSGRRLVDLQLCLRTDDIDEVGDGFHHTFFEMLGNWSLGDYWKREAIEWSYEFLTKELELDSRRIWITCFEGDDDAPCDIESSDIWQSVGIPKERIFFLPKKDNWWGPAGETGPCGPDTEIFYDMTNKSCGANCRPGDDCGRFVEIWNDVFMQYNKTKEGKFESLKQKNVDTGMGVDRTMAVLLGIEDDYQVPDLWGNIIKSIEEVVGKKYKENKKAFRIIADHTRAAVFVLAEGVYPSNKEKGYVLRRLIRRSVRYGKMLGVEKPFLEEITEATVDVYGEFYPRLREALKNIKTQISEEEVKFRQTLARGLKEIEKLAKLDGKSAFFLYESYGFPLELAEEIAKDRGQKVDREVFKKEFEEHKQLSRTASMGMFKGGLVDKSEDVTKLHTATHLLHAALRQVLGNNVAQKGSNINSERLRFDFSYPKKLTDEEMKKVEDIINEAIKQDLPVSFKTESLKEAIAEGALHFFAEKYGDRVKVYTVDRPGEDYFSKEVCGGPHVTSAGQIGRVRIIKQEKIGSGIVRIYAANRAQS
jgi:alanyl-tRNA synthetase